MSSHIASPKMVILGCMVWLPYCILSNRKHYLLNDLTDQNDTCPKLLWHSGFVQVQKSYSWVTRIGRHIGNYPIPKNMFYLNYLPDQNKKNNTIYKMSSDIASPKMVILGHMVWPPYWIFFKSNMEQYILQD